MVARIDLPGQAWVQAAGLFVMTSELAHFRDELLYIGTSQSSLPQAIQDINLILHRVPVKGDPGQEIKASKGAFICCSV
ncbi:hypothetical protein [Deinococcus aquiradiocola]|uniref:Uncharacterized protein n=1 Tax=Deinococcus aquiradiocola TaxID=393059 RepID=A0A917P834_9DEIO|nr:hypothetical protein [Deinococcus aquiradiocola]GGJ66228.1 hypothetical protein GCM10008939_07830 [Deinococcus aquiradiocola]